MRTPEEESINAYSHLFSSILSFFAMVVLVAKSPSVILELQFIFLGFTSTWAFFASFLYHSTSDKEKERNLIIDRVGIYLMIFGTGISFALTAKDPEIVVQYCSLITAGALSLIVMYCTRREENESFSIISYLLLGWFCIMPGTGLFTETSLGQDGIIWVITSVCFYSSGVVFYTQESKKWSHTVWHVLVLFGYASCVLAHASSFGTS